MKNILSRITGAQPRSGGVVSSIAAIIFFLISSSFIYAAPNQAPRVGAINPASGYSRPNQSVVFSTTFTDPNGWRNIQEASLLFGTIDIARNVIQPGYFCVYYNQNVNKLYMWNNATNKWIGGFTPGSARIIENQYGTLNCRNTTVLGAGTTLRINWNITFKSAAAGRRNTYLYVKDDLGLISNWTQAGSWIIDGTPPNGTITINKNAPATNSAQVTLTLSANDALTGVSEMKFSNNNVSWTASEPYAALNNWNLTAGDGRKTVYVKYKDRAGNWSGAYRANITLDTIPPQNPVITIDQGGYTNNPNITLTLSAEGASEMLISDNPQFQNSQWEAYARTKLILLSHGDGSKTIYIKYRDLARNETQVVSDSIILDTTIPQIEITSPENNLLINQTQIDISGTFNEENINTITVNGIQAVIQGNNFSIQKISLPNEGDNIITAQITDLAGNQNSSQINIIRDTIPPQSPVITIDQGGYTNNPNITLTLSAEGASEMLISDNPQFQNSQWEAYTQTKAILLPHGDGSKTIYIKYHDLAHNETQPLSDSIILDTTIPQIEITSPENNLLTNQTQINISGTFNEENTNTITVNGTQAVIQGNSFSIQNVPLPNESDNIVTAQITDLAGNQNSSQINIIRDTIPPAGTITIKNNTLYTNSTEVTLLLSANDPETGITQMQFSNNGIDWSIPETSAPIKNWILPAGDGTKTVHVKFKNGAGLWSNAFTDDIILDTVPPENVSITIDQGEYTLIPNITLTLHAEDITPMQMIISETQNFSDAVWDAYNTNKPFVLSNTEAFKTVYAKFRDALWNESDVVSAAIYLNLHNEIYPSFSPDGEKIVYVCDRQGNWDIWIKNTYGNSRHTQITDERVEDTQPAWSPDGTKIGFVTTRDTAKGIWGRNSDGTGDIFEIQPGVKSGGSFGPVVETKTYPDYSPKGDKIVMMWKVGNDSPEVAIGSTDFKYPVRLGIRNCTWPSFSPDGKEITYSLQNGLYTTDIYKKTVDGDDNGEPDNLGEVTQLTVNGFNNNYPRFSPDGAKIVYSSTEGGAPNIFVMDKDGNGSRQITNNENPTIDYGHPCFSPDGTKIVYHTNRYGRYDIYVKDCLTGQDAYPVAQIIQPISFTEIEDNIEIIGTANDNISVDGQTLLSALDHYILEYGIGYEPAEWHIITNSVQKKQNEQLGLLNVSEMQNGLYTIRLSAVDADGDTGISKVYLNIKKILPPQNPAINITPRGYTNSNNITLNLSAEGADEMIISENQDFADTRWEPYATTKQFILSGEDGAKTIYVKYKNKRGKETEPVSASVILDTTLPHLVIESPSDNSYINQDQINISGTFTEINLASITANGIQSVIQGSTFTVQNVQLPNDGVNTITVIITDLANNQNTYQLTITRDSIQPQIEITIPFDGYVTNQNTILVIGNYTEQSLSRITVNDMPAVIILLEDNKFSAGSIRLFEGINVITAEITDMAGNIAQDRVTITLDTIPPLTPNLEIEEGQYTNNRIAHLALFVEDASEMIISEDPNFIGANWEEYNLNRPFELSNIDGEKTIYVKYRDAAGNTTDFVFDKIILDTIPPQNISLNVDGGDFTNSRRVHLRINADGASSMIFSENLNFSNSEGEPFSSSKTFILSNDNGEKTIYFKCKDLAGNESITVSKSITLDIKPLDIIITSPINNASINQINLTVNGIINDNQAQITVNNVPAVVANGTFSANVANLQNGNNIITARAVNAIGEISNDSINVTLDNIAPRLAWIDTPPYTNSTNISILVVESSWDDIFEYMISESIDFTNASWQVYKRTPIPYSLSEPDGRKIIYFKARDKARNESNVVNKTVNLDRSPPTGLSVNFSTGNYTKTRSIWLTLNAVGASNVYISEGDITFKNINGRNYYNSISFNLSQGDGPKIVYVKFVDQAGNYGIAYNTITLDTSPPRNPFVAINEGDYTAKNSVNLTLLCDEAYQMRISGSQYFYGSSWQNFNMNASFNLSVGYGTKTVFAQFRDSALNESSVVSDTISRLNPQEDLDQDGLKNIEEEIQYRTDMNNSDTDQDEYWDGEEVLFNSDPLDPLDIPIPGGRVVINEVLVNPYSDNSKDEFIELYNPDNIPINIGGFIVQIAGNEFTDHVVIPHGTRIKAKGFYLIGGERVKDIQGNSPDLIIELALPNNQAETNGIRLVSTAYQNVIDCILYGGDNTNNLDTNDGPQDRLIENPQQGYSISRRGPGVDNNLAGDFELLNLPTPLSSNSLPDSDGDLLLNTAEDINHNGVMDAGETDPFNRDTDDDGILDGIEVIDGSNPIDSQSNYPLGRGIVINEIVYNPIEEDIGNEFIELFNSARHSIYIGGSIIQTTGEVFINKTAIPYNTVMVGKSFYLIGGQNVLDINGLPPDLTANINMGNAEDKTEGIRLKPFNNSYILDSLLYGEPNINNLDNSGAAQDGYLQNTIEGYSISRREAGADNNLVFDFEELFHPTPYSSRSFIDSDSDGISDYDEDMNDNDIVDEGETDPDNPDTDGDGLTDGEEKIMWTNPLVIDTDSDGVNDNTDAFPLNSGENLDTDKDGIGNNADIDDDNDGLADQEEINGNTNPVLADTDNDGLNDKQEKDKGTDPNNPDTDNDGEIDGTDDAPLNQDVKNDIDHDGADDIIDTDKDNDRILNEDELTAGTNPLIFDTDGDGCGDGEEIIRASNPLDRNSIPAESGGNVVINEISPGADKQEFIEIYNKADIQMDISELYIDRGSDEGFVRGFNIPKDTMIHPYGYILLADNPTIVKDVLGNDPDVMISQFSLTSRYYVTTGVRLIYIPLGSIDLQETNEQMWIEILNQAPILDAILYGEPNTYNLDTTGADQNNFISKLYEGCSISRKIPGQDNNSVNDFEYLIYPTPMSSRSGLDSDSDGLSDIAEDINANGIKDQDETDYRNVDTDGDGAGDFDEVKRGTNPSDSQSNPIGRGIVINEVLVNPLDGDTNREYVELYNNNPYPVDIGGFSIQAGDTEYSEKITILLGEWINAHDYFLIGGNKVKDIKGYAPDLISNLDLPNYSDYTIGTRLVSYDKRTILDGIIYNDSSANCMDIRGSARDGFLPSIPEGFSISRVIEGEDTDLLSDFIISENLTPKSAKIRGQQDDDNDGLTNALEREYRTNPINPDTDGDGINDGGEIRVSTNPLNPDSDGDGVDDYRDIYPLDPAQNGIDSDCDKLSDIDENIQGTDPDNPDSDGDGLKDGEEIGYGSNPLNIDSDNDGLADNLEFGIGYPKILNGIRIECSLAVREVNMSQAIIQEGTNPKYNNSALLEDILPAIDFRKTFRIAVKLSVYTNVNRTWSNKFNFIKILTDLRPNLWVEEFDPDFAGWHDETTNHGFGATITDNGDSTAAIAIKSKRASKPKEFSGYVYSPLIDLLSYCRDYDEDGINNILDPDSDNDGVLDGADACPDNADETIDTDHDGIGNNADIDDDNDGFNDADEVGLGSDPLNPDTDGDSFTDGQEYARAPSGVNNPDIFLPVSGRIVINEILYAPKDIQQGYHFIELYNPTDQRIDIGDFRISGSLSQEIFIPYKTFLAPGDTYLIGESFVRDVNGNSPDLIAELDFDEGVNNMACILLYKYVFRSSIYADAIIYGRPMPRNPSNFYGAPIDGLIPARQGGYSLSRVNIGIDTNSIDDFIYLQNPTPTVSTHPDTGLDTDSDGLIDSIDQDDDNDGVLDEQDLFPKSCLEQIDTDGDGIGNYEDTDDDGDNISDYNERRLGSDPLSMDSDADGVLDRDENAGGDYYADADNDGIYNISDPDSDNDGINDGQDLFPLDRNEQTDFDKDSIGDNADPDDDNDGLNDAEEIGLGTNPLKIDTDGDGFTDGEEVNKGADPLDTNSAPEPSGNGVVINEICYDEPDCDDLGNLEFIELYNASQGPVDISGYKIQTAGKRFTDHITLPGNIILNPNEFYLIGEKDVRDVQGNMPNYITKLSMGNGGYAVLFIGPADGVRLVSPDGNTVIDCLLYAMPNRHQLEARGAADDGFLPDVSPGQSLSRREAGLDTNKINDFILLNSPNPIASARLGVTRDQDNDGLRDEEEDMNGNGITDQGETDPDNKDTDYDGLSDKYERDIGLNPATEDTDNDMIKDKEEREPGADSVITNPLAADMDGDGLLDGYETTAGLNPLNNDMNNNEIPDGQDDFDNDGLNNEQEQERMTNPNNGDTDGDGIPDIRDLQGSIRQGFGLKLLDWYFDRKSNSSLENPRNVAGGAIQRSLGIGGWEEIGFTNVTRGSSAFLSFSDMGRYYEPFSITITGGEYEEIGRQDRKVTYFFPNIIDSIKIKITDNGSHPEFKTWKGSDITVGANDTAYVSIVEHNQEEIFGAEQEITFEADGNPKGGRYLWNIPGTNGDDYEMLENTNITDKVIKVKFLTTGLNREMDVQYTTPNGVMVLSKRIENDRSVSDKAVFDVVKVEIEDIERVPIFGIDPLGTNEKPINITITPSPLQHGGQMDLKITNKSGSGSAVFDNNSDSKIVTETCIVKVRGVINSKLKNSMQLIARIGSFELDSDSFTVTTWPINFKNTLISAGDHFGLTVGTSWDSESGDVADLGNVVLREYVTYSHPGANPPFTVHGADPTILPNPPVSGTNGHNGSPDRHDYNPLWVDFSTSISDYMESNQQYQFKDMVLDTKWEDGVIGTFTIRREVAIDPLGTYKFITSKTGTGSFSESVTETP